MLSRNDGASRHGIFQRIGLSHHYQRQSGDATISAARAARASINRMRAWLRMRDAYRLLIAYGIIIIAGA